MADKNLQHFESTGNYFNEEASPNETTYDQDTVSNKCNQCNYVPSQAGDLRRHLKTHNKEKQNKCNQCEYVSPYAFALKRQLKRHNWEKQTKLVPFTEYMTSYCPSQYLTLACVTGRLTNQGGARYVIASIRDHGNDNQVPQPTCFRKSGGDPV